MLKKPYISLIIASLLFTQISGTSVFAQTQTPDPYTLNTTLNAQVIPVVPSEASRLNPPLPNEIEKYQEKGYGEWTLGKSSGYTKRTDILPANVKAPTKSSPLAHFFTMSDIHIVDVQATTQPLYFGETPVPGMQSAYSGSMLYSTQVLDSAVRSVNMLNKKSKIDFGLMLGDAANNSQSNEVNMYLDVLTGRMVHPNSNPSKMYDTDYMQPFKAEGLDVPWYQVLGNHDHFWEGSYASSDKVKAATTGDTLMRFYKDESSQKTEGEEIYGGTIDPSTPYGKIVMSGKSNGDDASAHKVSPNTERRVLSAKDFVNIFPKNHGLKADTSVDPLACYVVDPKSNVPVRVIVLDNTAPQDTTFIDPTKDSHVMTTAAMAFLSKEKLAWLEKQMAQAQADNKLIVVATHIPTGMKGIWSSTSEVTEKQFIDTLLKYPNMSLLLAGHRHLNTVIPYKAETGDNGFWQVETSSLRDFPQQFKMFDIKINDNETISILANSVDPVMEKGSIMEKSRSYAIAASQIFPEPASIIMPAEKSRVENVELYKKLSPTMVKVLSKFQK